MQTSNIEPVEQLLQKLVERSSLLLQKLSNKETESFIESYSQYEADLHVLESQFEASKGTLVLPANQELFETLALQHALITTLASESTDNIASEIRQLNASKKALDAYGQ